MKKSLFISMAVLVGMFSFGALSVLAADSFGYCMDKQAAQQFTQETAALSSALKAKEAELSDQNVYSIGEASRTSSPDYGKINTLESEIKELKNKINASAKKYGVLAYYRQG